MKKIIKTIKLDVLINIILSFLTIESFKQSGYIVNYNFFTLLIYILIYYFYKNVNITKNINKKNTYLIIYSLIVSVILIAGNLVSINLYSTYVNIIKEIISIKSIVSIIGLIPLIFTIVIKLVDVISKLKNEKKELNNKKLYINTFIIIISIWSIYLLGFFPGIMTADSIDQLGQIINANISTNHHPVFHTLFMLIPFKIGTCITGNPNIGIAFISITQMIIMALIFSYTIGYLNKLKINNKIIILLILYYSLSPIFGFYSITLWKDIIFGGCILLFSITLYKTKININNLTLKNYIELLIISLLCMLFRNNGLYVMIVIIPLILLLTRKIKICIPLVISITIYLIITGPIFNMFGISKSSSKEYLAMPLQQIGRMAYKDLEFNKEEKEYFKNLIPVDVMKENYNPMNVDTIKFNKNFNVKAFDKNKLEFINVWSKLVIKYPGTAIESYLVSTLGYWYPNVKFWSVGTDIYKNDLGLKSANKFPLVKNVLLEIESRELTFFGIQWSIGTCILIILFLIIYNLHIKNKTNIICFLPVIGVWLTLMVASPVYAEFRYIFSAFCTLPFYLGISIKKKN